MPDIARPPATMQYEIVDETPPARRTRTNTPSSQLTGLLEKLVADDVHEWKRVLYAENKSAANGVLTRVKQGKIPVPDVEWEFMCRSNATEGWSKLFARFVGPARD